MDHKDIRYIVFLINPQTPQYMSNGDKIDTHDGDIFACPQTAKDYATSSIKEKLCTRFIIGRFVIDPQAEIMPISCIETFGFKNDKKNPNQLKLF